MSERDVPHPGDPYARANQNCAELAVRYPDLFSGEHISVNWPDGWHPLVVGVCAFADEHRIPVRWHQIKQNRNSASYECIRRARQCWRPARCARAAAPSDY